MSEQMSNKLLVFIIIGFQTARIVAEGLQMRTSFSYASAIPKIDEKTLQKSLT
jgi:hypothetical protein